MIKPRIVRLSSVALTALLLLAACGEGSTTVKDTAYWRAKFAQGDSEAIKALGAEGAAALPTLEALLRDDSETVVQTAAMAMGDLGASAAPAVPALLDAMGRYPGNAFIAQTLKELKGAAVPAMVEVLQGSDPDMKKQVATIAATLGAAGEPALPALIAILNGGDPDPVKLEAIGAVAAISVKLVNGDALPVLAQMKAAGGELAIYAERAIKRIEHAIEYAAKLAAEKAGN
jgi:HEAT repeat protein